MYTYYCKKCKNIIGKFINNYYNILEFCNAIKFEYSESIFYLNCKNCKNFVGIICYLVCKKCFGKDIIYGEKNLINWMPKFKKTRNKEYICYNSPCLVCNSKKYRSQHWFFEEQTKYI